MKVKVSRVVFSPYHPPFEYVVKMVSSIDEAKRFVKGKENKLAISVWTDNRWQVVASNK